MENVHETLHNELTYLSMVNNLLENNVGCVWGGSDCKACLGVQAGFDLGKSFPSLVSRDVDISVAMAGANDILKANKKALTLLMSQCKAEPDGTHAATIKHPQVNGLQILIRDNFLDVNVQLAGADVLNDVPSLLATMGILTLMFAAHNNCQPQHLSMQFASIWVAEDQVTGAKVMLNTEISPPAVMSLRTEAATTLKPISMRDITMTSWADYDG